eukprot:366305-Chlamydomonas_euryale.AAC.2
MSRGGSWWEREGTGSCSMQRRGCSVAFNLFTVASDCHRVPCSVECEVRTHPWRSIKTSHAHPIGSWAVWSVLPHLRPRRPTPQRGHRCLDGACLAPALAAGGCKEPGTAPLPTLTLLLEHAAEREALHAAAGALLLACAQVARGCRLLASDEAHRRGGNSGAARSPATRPSSACRRPEGAKARVCAAAAAAAAGARPLTARKLPIPLAPPASARRRPPPEQQQQQPLRLLPTPLLLAGIRSN